MRNVYKLNLFKKVRFETEREPCLSATCPGPHVWKLESYLWSSQRFSSLADPEPQQAWGPSPLLAVPAMNNCDPALWSRVQTTERPFQPTESCEEHNRLQNACALSN